MYMEVEMKGMQKNASLFQLKGSLSDTICAKIDLLVENIL